MPELVLSISKLKSNGIFKNLVLSNGQSFQLSTSSCIDKENGIILKDTELFAKCVNGLAQIFPSYAKKAVANIGGFSMEFLIKEITDDEELKSYKSLSQFHYKGNSLFGRTAILIAVSSTP